MLFKRFTHICTNIYTFCRNKRKATSLYANKTVLPKKKDLQNPNAATIYANADALVKYGSRMSRT